MFLDRMRWNHQVPDCLQLKRSRARSRFHQARFENSGTLLGKTNAFFRLPDVSSCSARGRFSGLSSCFRCLELLEQTLESHLGFMGAGLRRTGILIKGLHRPVGLTDSFFHFSHPLVSTLHVDLSASDQAPGAFVGFAYLRSHEAHPIDCCGPVLVRPSLAGRD
jgi:hypothetical protein